MRKAFVSAASVLAVLMAVSLTFLIPSGAVTEEAQQRYLDAAYAQEEGWEEASLPKPDAVLASAVFSDILPAATVDALPIDLFAPGNTPIAANYTENGYRDDTIIVELEQKRMYDSDVFIAYVKIATPAQLRTAVAGQKIGSSSTNQT